MDIKKFLADQGLQDCPAGLGGCRAHQAQFDSCDHDVVVFGGEPLGSRFLPYGDRQHVNLHRCSIGETRTSLLIHLDGMQVVSDDSWELGTLLSKLREKRPGLFRDHAKNCLIDSLFCCEKCTQGLQRSDAFSSCWQKCAAYLLADAVFALNQRPPSPSHMLEAARQFEKNSTNEKMSAITGVLGIERATPSLLERMLKSTAGFSDIVENNNHSAAIRAKHAYFVKNSMLSDCYFYLGYVNKANFLKIKDSVPLRPDLIHVLRTAFDLEADPSTVSQHARSIRAMCREILHSAFRE